MKVTIEIDCDNAAFEDDGAAREVARILKRLAHNMRDWTLEDGDTEKLMDLNGNAVGTFTVSR